MKIAVIGSGIAGLSCAWMLDPAHTVTVYEREAWLGGNARTLTLSRGGAEVRYDPAAQHVSAPLYPNFLRLMRILGIRCVTHPSTMVLYHPDTDRLVLPSLPPTAGQWLSLLDPRALPSLVRIGRAVAAAADLERRGDWTTTVEEFAFQLDFGGEFRDEVLYPLLTIFCGPLLDEIHRVSARAAMHYLLFHQPSLRRGSVRMLELEHGMGSYVQPLARRLTRGSAHTHRPVQALARDGERIVVLEPNGTAEAYDHVVLATPPPAALPLLDTLPGTEGLRSALGRFQYVRTAAYVHSDTSLLPRDRGHWGAVNQRIGRPGCRLNLWIGQRRGDDLFKTLADDTGPRPDALHAHHTYDHPLMTPAYYRAQEEVWSLQGQLGLSLVGAWLVGFECQESGIASALRVADLLAPGSSNTRLLRETRPEPVLA